MGSRCWVVCCMSHVPYGAAWENQVICNYKENANKEAYCQHFQMEHGVPIRSTGAGGDLMAVGIRELISLLFGRIPIRNRTSRFCVSTDLPTYMLFSLSSPRISPLVLVEHRVIFGASSDRACFSLEGLPRSTSPPSLSPNPFPCKWEARPGTEGVQIHNTLRSADAVTE